jgi:hypothetical protein
MKIGQYARADRGTVGGIYGHIVATAPVFGTPTAKVLGKRPAINACIIKEEGSGKLYWASAKKLTMYPGRPRKMLAVA